MADERTRWLATTSIWDPEQKDGDPSFVHVNDSPPYCARDAQGQLAHETTHSTAKPIDKVADGATTNPASIPGNCDGDIDLERNKVNIRCGDSSLPEDIKDARTNPFFFDSKLADLDDLLLKARKVIEEKLKNDPDGECAKLVGSDALSKFDDRKKNYSYDRKPFEGIKGGTAYALALTEDGKVSLNPDGFAFLDPFPGLWQRGKNIGPDSFRKIIEDSGASDQNEYAVAVIIHEFLHLVGKFKPDTEVVNGEFNSSRSEKYQKELISKCFAKSKEKR